MICERCRVETFLAYGREVSGKKIIVCYKCAKEIDEEENQKDEKIEEMKNKKDVFPAVLMQITQGDINAAISMFEEDEAAELSKIVWDTVLVGKLLDVIRENLVPYYNECSVLQMAIKKVVEDMVAGIDEKQKFLGGVRRYLKGNKEERK